MSDIDYDSLFQLIKKIKFNKDMKNFLKLMTMQVKENKIPIHDMISQWLNEDSFTKFIDKKTKEIKFIQPTCSICCEDFQPGFKPLDPCGHYIHEICVKKSKKNQCPICRVNVKLDSSNTKDSSVFTKGQKEHNKKREADPTRPKTDRDYLYVEGSDVPYYFSKIKYNKYDNNSYYMIYKTEEGDELWIETEIN